MSNDFDFKINNALVDATLEDLTTKTPTQIAETNAELKRQRRRALGKLARQAPMFDLFESLSATPAVVPFPPAPKEPPKSTPFMSVVEAKRRLEHKQALEKMEQLRSDINMRWGTENLQIICNITKIDALKSNMNTMAINLWGLMVMDATDFVPEDNEIADTDLYDSTIRSLFDNALVTDEMVDSLEDHLESKFSNAVADLRIITIPNKSPIKAPVMKEIASNAKDAEEELPDSSINPGWGTF